MSLDLGELVGTLRMDVTPFDQALAHGETALNSFAGTAKASAKNAGDQATEGLGTGLAGMEATAKAKASGVDAALGAELAGMDGTARAAGSGAAAALGAGLAGAEAEAKAAGAEAGKGFSDEFKDGAKTAGMAAGAGVGVAISAGVVDNLSVEAGLNKVAVQLGLSQTEMKVAGRVAGQVWANNFGEDLPQVNEAIAGVVKNIGIDINSVDLQPITEKVLTVADAFDQDLGMTTAAVGQMIRTGMVKDAQEGLDVLTAGLQTPADKAGDLAETMNEYGTQFRKLGLDGKDAMGLLSQGLQGGARDADIVADSIKEFTLKTQESTTMVTKLAGGETALNLTPLGEAFEAIGVQVLDANGNLSKAGEIFQKDLAGGGPKAKKALDQVLDGIKNIEDPAQRTATMVSLFGTQAEDMGDALLNLDLDTTAGELGKVEGAAQGAVDQMGSGTQATIDSYSRKLIDMGRSAIESTGPTAAIAGAVAAFGPAVVGIAGPIASLLAARAMQTAAAVTGGAAETAATTATTTGWIKAAAASTAGALKMAASWLIAIGPIALVIAAVAGVVFLVVKYWDEIKEYTGKAWDWVVDQVKKVPGLLVGFFMNFTLPGLIIKHWDDIKEGVKEKGGAMLDWVKAVPGKVLGFFSGAGSLLKDKGKDLLEGLKDGASNKWDQVKDWFSNAPERAKNAVGNAANTLKDKGRDLLQGLRDGAGDKWDAIVGWFQNAPERVTNAVGGVANTLKDKGRELFQGLRDGAGEKWDAIAEWVGNTGTRVKDKVGDLGGLLKSAGIAIIQGLIDGITEKFEALKDKVGAITKWVKDNKGPKAYDLTLWRGPGNWIMEGLMNGLDDQMPALKGKVGDVTDTIASTAMPNLSAAVAPTRIPESAEVASYGATRTAAAGGITQHIYETTDARATAAESARRLALAGAGA